MTREDRLLLADLARLNTAVTPLAMRIMEESATAEEYSTFAKCFAAIALRLQERATRAGLVVDGDFVIANKNSHGDRSAAHQQDL